MSIFCLFVCVNRNMPYICNVFFMVLDLRLTKIGCRDDNHFFYIHICIKKNRGKNKIGSTIVRCKIIFVFCRKFVALINNQNSRSFYPRCLFFDEKSGIIVEKLR